MKIKELKENISKYSKEINIPKNDSEHLVFKNVFDNYWEKELKKININETLTYEKKTSSIYNSNEITSIVFKETKYEITSEYSVLYNFSYFNINKFKDEINLLKEGDEINVNCEVRHLNSFTLNQNNGNNQPIINIIIEIISFDKMVIIDNKKEVKKKTAIKKKTIIVPLKESEDIVNTKFKNIKNEFNSFQQLLFILVELKELKSKSKEKKSDLTTFQNEIYNKKYLDIYNSKKVIVKNLKGLEFNIICEVSEISKDNIDFTIKYNNKSFFLLSKNYNKELQDITFFLKNNSSVEIKFKMEELNLEYFSSNIYIDLISIKINNKVKLFGKFIKLEYFWLGIYLFLILYTLILFSDIHFYGVIPFLFKLTLWVFFGYLINKLLVNKIYKN